MVLPEGTVRDQVTGIDICDDGLRLVMLTYTSVHLWQRELGEGWRETLARAPRSIPLPRLAKAEAISFSADGQAIHVASERLPTPLVTIELPTP